MRSTTVLQSATVEGIGLITGLPVQVTLEAPPESASSSGIVFYLHQRSESIPASLRSVVHTDRGVTLASSNGKTLSIVEHFLSACSLLGIENLSVVVEGAPELPILDGSAAPWFEVLKPFAKGVRMSPNSQISLPNAVFHRESEAACLYALPSDRFQVTYTLDYPHPDVKQQWGRWDAETEGPEALVGARTFGFVSELPELLARGLAKGVRPDNTLGLTEEGTYTDALRLEQEPLRHKILDLLGDLTLMGMNPLRLNTHLYAINAGHTTHIQFARKLLKHLG
jgi:UDP-3-O-[3-hydroxymyristoyl] N-acetylglucosamine deacetylase